MKILNRVIPLKAHAPKFSKPKDVGWFLMLGSTEHWELLALKRNTNNRFRTSSSRLAFNTPINPSKLLLLIYIIMIYYYLM